MKEAMNQLRTSLQNAPVIWKGDYPYFIHPVTDGVPRMDPDVLKAIVVCRSQPRSAWPPAFRWSWLVNAHTVWKAR